VDGSGQRSGPARTGESGSRGIPAGAGRAYRGAVPAPDPAHVRTPDQFVAALNALRGNRSYKALTRAHPTLRQSTLGDLLTGKSTPTRETVAAFLTACGLDHVAQQPWLAAQDRAAAAHPRPSARAVRVRAAVARRLGVHPSIQTSTTVNELPEYVARDFDFDLRRMLSPGAFVLLRGGSSTGKTRALFEAVRETLPDWWLLLPDDDSAPGPRTVLWLDELQRCHVPAGRMRSVLAAGAIAVGTLWPDEYNCRIAPRRPGQPDPYAEQRELLGLAHVIDVPEAFTAAERRRAERLAADDHRLRIALSSTDAGVTQVLAAGPELIRRWANADTTDPRQCAGRAIITAALDARRVGARTPLTREFLATAAPGLSDRGPTSGRPAGLARTRARLRHHPRAWRRRLPHPGGCRHGRDGRLSDHRLPAPARPPPAAGRAATGRSVAGTGRSSSG
jgi:hypothetical protein